MKLFDKIKKVFEPCEHVWRFFGKGVRKALVPEWLFKCPSCDTEKWRAEGCFPDEESYIHYKEKMGIDFKETWNFIVNEEDNQVELLKNKQAIVNGTYFKE